MYLEYYGLSRHPFQITPDVNFFYDSRVHKRALATIIYGLSKKEGFIVVTGEVGSGKTTLIEYMLSNSKLQDVVIARVSTTQLVADSLLALIAGELGLSGKSSGKAELLRELKAFFVDTSKAGRSVLLIVDEVQNLSPDALEELRMLSNFQNAEHPLLQMLLVGQPEFRERLASPECEQIRQRVIVSYHLAPLPDYDVPVYIEHRLRQAGRKGLTLFARRAYRKIFDETGGIPRKVNRLCDRLLLFGYLEEIPRIDEAAVDRVVAEMREENLSDRPASKAGPSTAHDAGIKIETASQPEHRLQPGQRLGNGAQPVFNGGVINRGDYAELIRTLRDLRREVKNYKMKMDHVVRLVAERQGYTGDRR